MSLKHTPGPLDRLEEREFPFALLGRSDQTDAVCWLNRGKDNWHANAALFAHADELLTAAKEARDHLENSAELGARKIAKRLNMVIATVDPEAAR